jgi:hypothetical protein
MEIPQKSFTEFKELMRRKVGDSEYSKMTEQELYESAQKLLRLVEIVEKPESK